MGVGVASKECEPVGGPLVDRNLQRIVSGNCPVPELNDVVQIWKFLGVRRGCSFIGGDGRIHEIALATVFKRRSAGDAKGRWAYSPWQQGTWIIPSRAERRLVNVHF